MVGCRFCQGKNLVKVLDLGDMPLAGGFLKEEDFSKEKKYPLYLNFCKDCYLVQVGEVPPQQNELYKHTLFRSSTSKTVVKHFEEFAKELNDYHSVLEIGSNDGALIKPLIEMGINAIGIDPVTNDYFTEKLALRFGLFDAVVSSYTFSHIDDMVDVMKGVKHIIKENGVFIFESYYLGNLLDELQYDMIYHEHMSYFSILSVANFLKRFGMEIFNLKYIPNFRSGCMRFYACNIGKQEIMPVVENATAIEREYGYNNEDIFSDFASSISKSKDQLILLLHNLKMQGKTIVGYGATGRGTIMMNYCGIDKHYLDYVVDDTPEKQGLFTPGMHVPIKAWDGESDFILLFSWAFADEIMKKHKDYRGKWIIPLPKLRVV